MKFNRTLFSLCLVVSANALAENGASKHFANGFDLMNQGQLDSAAAEFKKGLASSPRDSKAHFYLGEIYRQQNRNDLAAKQYGLTLQYASPNSEDASAAIASLSILNKPASGALAATRPLPTPESTAARMAPLEIPREIVQIDDASVFRLQSQLQQVPIAARVTQTSKFAASYASGTLQTLIEPLGNGTCVRSTARSSTVTISTVNCMGGILPVSSYSSISSVTTSFSNFTISGNPFPAQPGNSFSFGYTGIISGQYGSTFQNSTRCTYGNPISLSQLGYSNSGNAISINCSENIHFAGGDSDNVPTSYKFYGAFIESLGLFDLRVESDPGSNTTYSPMQKVN